MRSTKPRSAYAARTYTQHRALVANRKDREGESFKRGARSAWALGLVACFCPPSGPHRGSSFFVWCTACSAQLTSPPPHLGRRTTSSTAPFSLCQSLVVPARALALNQGRCEQAFSVMLRLQNIVMLNIFNMTISYPLMQQKHKTFLLQRTNRKYAHGIFFIICINPISDFAKKKIENFYITDREIQTFKVFSVRKKNAIEKFIN